MRVPLPLVLLAFGFTHPVAAQDTLTVIPDGPPAGAFQPTPITMKPLGAFFRSLVVPGWGQAALDRKLTATLFVAWEGVTLGMALKASHELRHLERTGSSRVDAKRQERQDWLVLVAFNHLFAGLEAFVSSQLADFPSDIRLRHVPGGAAVSIPIRIP